LTINITFAVAKRYFLGNFSRFLRGVLFSGWLPERYNYPNINNSIAYMINRCRRFANLSPSVLPFLFFTCKRVGTRWRRYRRPHRMSMRDMSLSTLKLFYTGCSTHSCYLESYSDTENAFVMLDLNDLGVFTMFIFHIRYAYLFVTYILNAIYFSLIYYINT